MFVSTNRHVHMWGLPLSSCLSTRTASWNSACIQIFLQPTSSLDVVRWVFSVLEHLLSRHSKSTLCYPLEPSTFCLNAVHRLNSPSEFHFSPNALFLLPQHSTSHDLSFLTSQHSTWPSGYLYLKDERALPRNACLVPTLPVPGKK